MHVSRILVQENKPISHIYDTNTNYIIIHTNVTLPVIMRDLIWCT